jgi:hypothetical protein
MMDIAIGLGCDAIHHIAEVIKQLQKLNAVDINDPCHAGSSACSHHS